MDPVAVRAEIATALRTITGLSVYEHDAAGKIPAAIVSLPDRIDYNATYARGLTAMADVQVIILCGAPGRLAEKAALGYAKDTGGTAVVAVLQGYAWTTFDWITVEYAEFLTVTMAGVDRLAVVFHANLAGRGA